VAKQRIHAPLTPAEAPVLPFGLAMPRLASVPRATPIPWWSQQKAQASRTADYKR